MFFNWNMDWYGISGKQFGNVWFLKEFMAFNPIIQILVPNVI